MTDFARVVGRGYVEDQDDELGGGSGAGGCFESIAKPCICEERKLVNSNVSSK